MIPAQKTDRQPWTRSNAIPAPTLRELPPTPHRTCRDANHNTPSEQRDGLFLSLGADGEFAYRVGEPAVRAAEEIRGVQDQPDGFLSAWL